MTRTIVLAGAPESTDLDWNKENLLSMKNVERAKSASTNSVSSSRNEVPKWRQLEMDRLKMRPMLPKLNIEPQKQELDHAAPADFLDAAELLSQDFAQEETGSDVSAEDSRPSQTSQETESEALAEFYDHSFAIHDAIPSSQAAESTSHHPDTPTYESSEEMFSLTPSTPGGIIRSPSPRRLSQAPRPKVLTHLENIPNASFLSSIQPQTKTVNLIVGILSLAPTRTVMTGAKFGRPQETELVEMTVGDDTKTAFSITMWLPREMRVNWKDGALEKPEGARSHLRRSLKTLRPRDVVLIQNLALSTFRGKVHGQSLRGDVTKIDLLFRKKIADEETVGVYNVQNLRMATGKDTQILKVKRVRDWLVNTVGDAPVRRTGRRFPSDTQ